MVSAKAVDDKSLKALYDYNMKYIASADAPIYATSGAGRKKKRGGIKNTDSGFDESGRTTWAGFNVRMMLWLFYTISFLCLLRCDEALRIRWEDIEIEEWEVEGKKSIRLKITLPFRKTHQNGGQYLIAHLTL